jgi:hypothetical protein
MKLERTKFFSLYRGKFGKLTQKQVDAIEAFLSALEQYPLSLREAAYIFATVYHETAKTFLPLEEYGKGRGKAYGKPVNGKKYYGRGYVQLTWDYNYEKATKELRKQFPAMVADYEKKHSVTFDLIAHPEQAMDVEIACAILVVGSLQGWFTGKKLSDYINSNKADFINARRVINGIDRAKLIAGQAQKFKGILSESLEEKPKNVVVDTPLQPKEAPSVEPVSTPATDPKVSLFTKIGTAVTGIAGLGINLGTMVETQINRLTPAQVLYLCLSLALVGLAVWWYRQSANNAHAERMAKGGNP